MSSKIFLMRTASVSLYLPVVTALSSSDYSKALCGISCCIRMDGLGRQNFSSTFLCLMFFCISCDMCDMF